MDEKEAIIRSECALYACRCCRTKTGWPHQRWCALAALREPGCGECRYYNEKQKRCIHPGRKAVTEQ